MVTPTRAAARGAAALASLVATPMPCQIGPDRTRSDQIGIGRATRLAGFSWCEEMRSLARGTKTPLLQLGWCLPANQTGATTVSCPIPPDGSVFGFLRTEMSLARKSLIHQIPPTQQRVGGFSHSRRFGTTTRSPRRIWNASPPPSPTPQQEQEQTDVRLSRSPFKFVWWTRKERQTHFSFAGGGLRPSPRVEDVLWAAPLSVHHSI